MKIKAICSQCNKEFEFSRYSRIDRRRLQTGQVVCGSCQRSIAQRQVLKTPEAKRHALEASLKTRQAQSQALRQQTDQDLLLPPVRSYNELCSVDRRATAYECECCHRIFQLRDKKAIGHYIKNHVQNQKLLCRSCGITYTKVQRGRDNLASKLFNCRFIPGQEYIGSALDLPRDQRPQYRFICNNCHQEFLMAFPLGTEVAVACPVCYPHQDPTVSRVEKELVAYLKQVYSGTVIENDRSVLAPKELDIYLPEKQLAIELDGVYWHNNSKKTLEKYKACQEKGIRLIMIYDYEWRQSQKKIQSYLCSQLGIFTRSIGARKCAVQVVMADQAKAFLADNHLQETTQNIVTKSSVCLGLYDQEGTLLELEVFNRPRYNRKYSWELIRECSKAGVQVIGGKQRLLMHFRKQHSGSIISYCDKRLFSGRSYNTWLQLPDSPPDYRYYKSGKAERREKYMKAKLPGLLDHFDPQKSETRNMLDNGYLKIWDFGNFVFTLD